MKDPTQHYRLVLADDHPLVRAGIRAELEKLPHVEVVGEAGNGREVIELVKLHHPSLVFIDISMPGLNGLEAVARLTKEFPDVRVVILSMHENQEYVWRALKAGAVGYLLKRAATTELSAALEAVREGRIYLSRQLSVQLDQKLPGLGIAGVRTPLDQLTDRQREILQLIAEGQNTKEIAETLKLSPKTVEYHRLKLMEIVKIHDVPGLVRFALRNGLVALDE
ncbi:MAG: response regulator transcription factor [Verrucomicrobiota bacterium]